MKLGDVVGALVLDGMVAEGAAGGLAVPLPEGREAANPASCHHV